MAKVSRGSDQFPLRLPDGMRDRIKESAEAAGRSMNAEIILRLERSLLLDSADTVRQGVRMHQNDMSAEALEHLKRAIELLSPSEV